MTYVHYEHNGKKFSIEREVAKCLISLCANIKDDWDLVILISGNRMVRVGKSVLAMNIANYLSYILKTMKLNENAFHIDNIFWDNKNIISRAKEMAKYNIILYDEAREGLAASKALTSMQQDLIDFFTECGQLNHIFILVLPDFFDLRETIAVSRSELLFNVYRQDRVVLKPADTMKKFGEGFGEEEIPIVSWQRGNFTMFNRQAKALLYGLFQRSRIKSYSSVKATLWNCNFNHEWPIDELEYKKRKLEALSRVKIEKVKPENKHLVKYQYIIQALSSILPREKVKSIEESFGNPRLLEGIRQKIGNTIKEEKYDLALADVKNKFKENTET